MCVCVRDGERDKKERRRRRESRRQRERRKSGEQQEAFEKKRDKCESPLPGGNNCFGWFFFWGGEGEEETFICLFCFSTLFVKVGSVGCLVSLNIASSLTPFSSPCLHLDRSFPISQLSNAAPLTPPPPLGLLLKLVEYHR